MRGKSILAVKRRPRILGLVAVMLDNECAERDRISGGLNSMRTAEPSPIVRLYADKLSMESGSCGLVAG